MRTKPVEFVETSVLVSQKCQYALRALFELAKHFGATPVRAGDVAERQAIPARFLEAILAELKHAGLVVSRRGRRGGYSLNRHPATLTAGDVIRFFEGPLGPVPCAKNDTDVDCPLYENCVFLPMWERVREAVAGVYDTTTFQDLVEAERQRKKRYVPVYHI